MTDKQLQKRFRYLNERFFNNRIREVKPENVRYGTEKECRKADGIHNSYTNTTILIDENLRKHSDLTTLILLHEMVHADLTEEGYVGHCFDRGHGLRFQAALDRLYKIGAYDSLL